MTKPKISREAGFSLVGAMIALVILGIAAAGIATLVTNTLHAVKGADMRSDMAITRDYIYRSLSCGRTFPAALAKTCRTSAKKYVPLLDSAGAEAVGLNNLVNANGVQIANWWIRASCSSNGRRLLVEGKRGALTGSGDKQRLSDGIDPLSGRTEDWRDLFTSMNLCEDQLIAPADLAVPENLSDQRHIRYYPSGVFRAVGGDVQVSVTKVWGAAKSQHTPQINGVSVADAYSFRLAKDGTFTFQVAVAPGGGEGTTYNPSNFGPNVWVIEQGLDMYKVQIEDTLEQRDAITFTDSIWSITSTPL